MNIHSNDFELFGLDAVFSQTLEDIDLRWKKLQREVHPDKFSSQGTAAQRVAMQWSVRINEAYRRLKNPLNRAAYLCELNGIAVDAENNTAMPTTFLMQQMEWREALDDAKSAAELKELTHQVQVARQKLLEHCEHLLDKTHDYAVAVQQVRALMFVERFALEVESRSDLIDGL